MESNKINKRIVLDIDLCIGCRSCAAACALGHHEQANVMLGQVGETAMLPLHCRHCEQPACVEVCPTAALEKDEFGFVHRSNLLCIGCHSCVFACPFGAISQDLMKHVTAKCDLCIDRVLVNKIPRCVATCTSGALSFREITEVSAEEVWIGGRISSRAIVRRL
ncbi:4Fe-4S dicluster domain-containing protein [candidate division KSB1 bacterium]